MTDQRSAFRFRIPRLRPSVPPPRSTTQTTRTKLPPPKLPIRPQVDPSPPPPPQGTAPGPPAASTLPSPPPPPPIRPQGTTSASPPPPPLPVVQSPPQAALASPTPPLPIRPQGTTPAPPPTPALLITPSPSQEPAASPPTVPIRSLGTVPASPPEPLVEPSTSTQPIHPFGTVPASHQSHPLNHQRYHTPALQDEATPSSPLHSSLPKLKTAKPQESSKTKSPPSSSSQTTIQSRLSSQPPSPSPTTTNTSTQPHFVSAKPPSPLTRSPSTSQPSSPSRYPSPPPEVKRSTKIASSSGQRGAHLVLNATPTTETNEEASMELSSEHSNSEPHIRKQPKIKTQNAQENQHESEEDTISTSSNIPKTPKTKSMISLPEDKIPVPESPKNLKLNGPQTLSSKKTTSINLPNHHSNEKSPIVITLAGENRGTSMHIGSGAAKRHWKIHIHRKYRVNPDEITDTTTDGEESSEEKKKENDLKPNENKEKDAYINCNVQGINNSVMFNSSVTERNPGVHRGSSSKPLEKPKRNKDKVNITPSQSQTHTIRRRCLRGLFMESSSDSDPNGPQKPRRHGCRYKSNKDDIAVVV